jgi:PIN domain nuclease of toxin-antitoxin system
MRLLLDTHVALWAVTDDPQLSEAARALIVEPANEVFISVAAIWEIAIKHAVRRRVSAMPVSAETALNDFLAARFQATRSLSSDPLVDADSSPPR